MEQKYGRSHTDGMVLLQNSIAEEVGVKEALSSIATSTTAKATHETQSRTAAAPDWQGEPPQNPSKVLTVSQSKELAEFEKDDRLDLYAF